MTFVQGVCVTTGVYETEHNKDKRIKHAYRIDHQSVIEQVLNYKPLSRRFVGQSFLSRKETTGGNTTLGTRLHHEATTANMLAVETVCVHSPERTVSQSLSISTTKDETSRSSISSL